MGTIKDSLTFDDVTLVPQYSSILPTDAITNCKLSKNLNLQIPLISSAMDIYVGIQLFAQPSLYKSHAVLCLWGKIQFTPAIFLLIRSPVFINPPYWQASHDSGFAIEQATASSSVYSFLSVVDFSTLDAALFLK